jgi:hypothetical protein
MTVIPFINSKPVIVGIAGAHSTGKTKLLQVLSTNYNISVDTTSSLSRAAQQELGFSTLEEATSTYDGFWNLQELILQKLSDRDSQYIPNTNLVLVDRTPAELFAYATVWRRKHPDRDDGTRYRNYTNTCFSAMRLYRGIIYRHINPKFPFVAEPNRASLEDREETDKNIQAFLNANVELPILDSWSVDGNLQEEIDDILSFLEELKGNDA